MSVVQKHITYKPGRAVMPDDELRKLIADVAEPSERGVIPAGNMRRRSSAYRQPVEQTSKPIEPNTIYIQPRTPVWRFLLGTWKRALVTGMCSIACIGCIGYSLINPIWGITDRWEHGLASHPRTDIKSNAIGYGGDSEGKPTRVTATSDGNVLTVLVQSTADPNKVMVFNIDITQPIGVNMTPEVTFEQKDGDGRIDIVIVTKAHQMGQLQNMAVILNTEKGLIIQKPGGNQ